MKSLYILLLFPLIFISCDIEDFKIIKNEVSIRTFPDLTEVIDPTNYFKDNGDFSIKMLYDFGDLIYKKDFVKYRAEKENQEKIITQNFKELINELTIKNNTKENIEEAVLTVILKFKFNNSDFYFSNSHSLLRNNEIWQPDKMIESKLNELPIISFDQLNILNNHNPENVQFKIYIKAKNSIGYKNFLEEKKEISGYEPYLNYQKKYGKFNKGKLSEKEIKNLGEEVHKEDITVLWNQKVKKTKKKTNDTKCDTIANIANTKICLPELSKMSNILKVAEYDNYVKQFSGSKNTMLAFYLDNTAVAQEIKPSYNCASVYINSEVQGDVGNTVFKAMSKTMGDYLKKADNLKTIIKDIENNYFQDLSFDTPIVINSYNLNDDIVTYVLLGKTIENEVEIVTLTTLNLMHVKNKMVLSNYIIKYDNSNSINVLKQKNDYFIMRIMEINK